MVNGGPRPAARTAVRADTVARDEPVRDARDTRDVESTDEKPTGSKAEFSALLALLAASSVQGPADPAKQLPPESARLVAPLLDDAIPSVKTDDDADGDADGDVDSGGGGGVGGGVDGGVDGGAASEALRYGMLSLLPLGDITGTPVIDLAAYTKARDARLSSALMTQGTPGLVGMARALPHATSNGAEQPMAALTRVASRRGASLEQLLAVGDATGANARAALDAILAQAGTPGGLRLADAKRAARMVMADSRAIAFGTDDTAGTMDELSTLMGGTNAAAHPDRHALMHAAHASTLAAANATSAANPTNPVSDLDAVAPALRARVERVIDRMKQEYGHDVTVVESARSQERQDWLYAQGRTRSGPVVTWTRDSAHTRGEAVDVIIDGTWDNPDGFARLQRIAREEGLRTLGMKDPGHLELAKGEGMPDDPTAMLDAHRPPAARAAQRASSTGGATSARVAQVAGVAQIAGVARVADAATAGPTSGEPATKGLAAYAAQQQAARGQNEQGNGDAMGRETRDEPRKPMTNGDAVGPQKVHGDEAPTFGGLHPGSAPSPGTGGERTAQPSPAAGSEQAQRVSDVQQMRADAPVTSINRMSLKVESANGVQQEVTVDLRGNVVSTHITTDAAMADRMRLRTADLQDALGRHGLEADTVKISGLKPVDAAEGARAIGNERDTAKIAAAQQGTAQDGTSRDGQRDRAPSREGNQEESRREHAARARDQRDQQERQQRSQRPEFLYETL